jgi:curved DNA-binding protein
MVSKSKDRIDAFGPVHSVHQVHQKKRQINGKMLSLTCHHTMITVRSNKEDPRKAMPGKDYYKILEVPRTASQEEIKKSYRRLAMKFHPDRNENDKTAEARFKEINEAYAVLSNPEKRKQYDTFGADHFGQRYSQEDIFRDFDFSSIFKEFGFGGGAQNIFGQMFGGRSYARGRGAGSPLGFDFDGFQGRPASAKGQDLVYELSVTLEEAAIGTSKLISYQDGEGQQTISVKIPVGISTGKKLRLPGKGRASLHGGPRGDLYVQIRVLEHPLFRREGDDLIMTREIRFSEALSGTEVEIPTIDRRSLKLKVPAGTPCNAKFRLKGYGMPRMNEGSRGDAYVQVIVGVPQKLTKKQKTLLKEMEDAGL